MLEALLAALAPANTVPQITTQYVTQARDRWLLCLLALGAVLVWPAAPWLSPIALWFVLFYSGRDDLESVVPWIGVGASWYLLRAIPAPYWDAIPYFWLAAAQYQAFLVIRQKRKGIRRPHGSFGSAPNLANLLALVFPFALSGWGLLALPGLLVSLWLTSSLTAFVGVAAGGALLHPYLALGLASTGFLGLLADYQSRHTQRRFFHRWIDRVLPRSASNGTVRGRWVTVKCLVRSLTLRGAGPRTTTNALLRWGARLNVNSIPPGESCCDPLQFIFEYGLLGAISIGLFLWQIVPHLRWGDPWSAAFVTTCVISLAHYPTRLVPNGVVFLAVAAHLVSR